MAIDAPEAELVELLRELVQQGAATDCDSEAGPLSSLDAYAAHMPFTPIGSDLMPCWSCQRYQTCSASP